jgi:hypothetical protein
MHTKEKQQQPEQSVEPSQQQQLTQQELDAAMSQGQLMSHDEAGTCGDYNL